MKQLDLVLFDFDSKDLCKKCVSARSCIFRLAQLQSASGFVYVCSLVSHVCFLGRGCSQV